MSWMFKPRISHMNILIIFIMSKFGFNLFGFWWGILVMFILFFISNMIEEKIWKVENL